LWTYARYRDSFSAGQLVAASGVDIPEIPLAALGAGDDHLIVDGEQRRVALFSFETQPLSRHW
jgi:hypothetical protein